MKARRIWRSRHVLAQAARESMKQKQRILEGSTGSNLKELSEAETNSQSMRKKNQGGWFVLEDLLLILTLTQQLRSAILGCCVRSTSTPVLASYLKQVWGRPKQELSIEQKSVLKKKFHYPVAYIYSQEHSYCQMENSWSGLTMA